MVLPVARASVRRRRSARPGSRVRGHVRRRAVRERRRRFDLAGRVGGDRRPARDVGQRVPVARRERGVGRLRRDRAEQPVPIRGRGKDLAAAARAATAAERATLVFPPAPLDPPRAHDRAAPDRSGLARGRDRARRRDALARRRRDLDRPQPPGAQRRPPAPDAPARARAPVRGRRPGDRGVARSGRELAPAGRRARPALRVGDRRRSRPTRTSGTRRSAADRTPPTAAATASRCCCARAGTAGRRSTAGATTRRCGGCRTRWRRCPDSRIGCWSGSAADRCW